MRFPRRPEKKTWRKKNPVRDGVFLVDLVGLPA